MYHVYVRAFAAFYLFWFAAMPAAAQRPSTYRDPQGRFSLELPAGFTATQLNNDAVQFANGAAYVTAMVVPGGDPGVMFDGIARQTGGQWRNFTAVRRGEAHFGGHTGQYRT